MTFPTGNVTFLFTDIEGSSRLWEANAAAMGPALALHDRILRTAVLTHRGVVFKTVGDAFCAVFNEAPDAVAAATAAQRQWAATDWETGPPLKVRVAIHTGVAELREADYFGPTLNRVARILAAGHGGQTLLSLATEQLAHDRLPADVQLQDLGENRLKDLARPERIFELKIDGLAAQFPPLRSLEQYPNNLPVQLTTFIGRETEVAAVRRHLDGTHLLTLTGPGGTGKTRLSLQVAAEVADQYPDGVWLVELAVESAGPNVAVQLAQTLGLRVDAEPSVESALITYCRRKKLLVLLDNCEHLIGAVAHLAEALLRAAPQLRIIASSRTPLGIAGELTWPVPPLSTPQPSRWGTLEHYTVEELSRFEAVRLFVERATAAVPSFRLTSENAQAIARIGYRLDGVALALELAAARIKVLTPEQIADRLQNRFALLTGGSRTALPRQQTLRALIDWSYDLLSDRERALFRRLAVFAGGRSLAAVEAVCSDADLPASEILDLLTQLLDKSLISLEDGPVGEPRYVLTESIWQYAQSRLEEATEAAGIRDQHLAHFRTVAEQAAPGLAGPDQARVLERLAADRINFRYALEWSTRDPDRAESGLRVAVALSRFWEVRSNLKEGRDHLDRLLAAASPAPRRLLALAWGAAARLAWCQDANRVARDFALRAVELLRVLGDEETAAEYVGLRGFIERLEHETTVAETCFQECLAGSERFKNLRLRAFALAGMGSVADDRGDFALGHQLKLECREILRRQGDRYFLGLSNLSLADNALKAGRLDEAEACYTECLEIALELANRWTIPHLLEGAGEVARARGQWEKGLSLFATASVLRERLGLQLTPLDGQAYEASLKAFRESLDPAEYARIWNEGRLRTPPDAIRRAFPSVVLY